jgi:hypothetical protein
MVGDEALAALGEQLPAAQCQRSVMASKGHLLSGAHVARPCPQICVTMTQALLGWEQNWAGPHIGRGPDDDFLAAMQQNLLSDDEFCAGLPSTRLAEWIHFFNAAKSHDRGMLRTPETKQVLLWIQEGVRVNWGDPFSPQQRSHPLFTSKVASVHALLQETVAQELVAQMSQGQEPHQVEFANRISVEHHQEFVREEIQALVATGAVQAWKGPEPIRVINGLGVVVNRKGKKRLILDARYINLFDQYEKFKYERLSDVPTYLQQTDVIALSDFKSGYHHLKMHPSAFKFLGFQFDNQVYYFSHLPFGLSCACRVYTIIMGEVYRPLRQSGLRMTYLIDDALYAFADQEEAMVRVYIIMMLLTALGFCLSFLKCILLPAAVGTFLGLLVLVREQSFKIPADKLQHIRECISHTIESQPSKRDLARIAGLLLSVAPAVYMAPLYTRRLYLAMSRGQEWGLPLDEQAQQLSRKDLEFWLTELQGHQGKTWVRRSRIFHCCGDVSDTGFAGYSEELVPIPLVTSYDLNELQALWRGELSSVYRETKNAALVIKACIFADPLKVKGGLIVYTGDNTGATACLSKMMGKGHTLDEVRELYRVANAAEVHLEFIWQPGSPRK